MTLQLHHVCEFIRLVREDIEPTFGWIHVDMRIKERVLYLNFRAIIEGTQYGYAHQFSEQDLDDLGYSGMRLTAHSVSRRLARSIQQHRRKLKPEPPPTRYRKESDTDAS